MQAFLSRLTQALPVAFALAVVAALFAALRLRRIAAPPAVPAPVIKPVPVPQVQPLTGPPAVAYGGCAKGQNFDLFGGWPEGYAPPGPSAVKAQVDRIVKLRLPAELHAQLKAQAQARGQQLGPRVLELLQAQIRTDLAVDLATKALIDARPEPA